MAAKIQNRTVFPLLTLLGVLAFNLSSLPGSPTGLEVHSSDLLSTGCNLKNRVDRDGSAECRISKSTEFGVVKGRIKVEKKTVTTGAKGAETEKEVYQLVEGDLRAGDALKTDDEDGDLDSETKCEECMQSLKSQQFASIEQLNDALEDQAAALAERAKDEKKKIARQKKIDNCEISKETEKPFKNGSAAQVGCLMSSLETLDDTEAQEFFDEKVRGKLQALIESGNVADRAKAYRLLADYNQRTDNICQTPVAPQVSAVDLQNMMMEDVSAKDYVKSSACDMQLYAKYNATLGTLYTNAAMITDPTQRAMAARQLADIKSKWGGYFQARGLELGRQGGAGYNDFASTQLDALNGFNAQLKQNFQDIVTRYQAQSLPDAQNGAVDASLDRAVGVDQPYPGNGRATTVVTGGEVQVGNGRGVRGVDLSAVSAFDGKLPLMPADKGTGHAPRVN